MIGTVKFFNEKKGYGFLGTDERENDIFVHFSAIAGSDRDFKKLEKDQKVEFEVERTKDGQERAVNVRVIG